MLGTDPQTSASRPDAQQESQVSDFWHHFARLAKGQPPIVDRREAPQGLRIDGTSVNRDAAQTAVLDRTVVVAAPPEFRREPWRENFLTLARWEGRVVEVTPRTLVAVLNDELDRTLPEEEAEIPLEEISQADMGLVRPGALFYWSIGYRLHASGQRSRESIIRFRRLPRWSTEEVEEVDLRIDESQLRIKSADPECDLGST